MSSVGPGIYPVPVPSVRSAVGENVLLISYCRWPMLSSLRTSFPALSHSSLLPLVGGQQHSASSQGVCGPTRASRRVGTEESGACASCHFHRGIQRQVNQSDMPPQCCCCFCLLLSSHPCMLLNTMSWRPDCQGRKNPSRLSCVATGHEYTGQICWQGGCIVIQNCKGSTNRSIGKGDRSMADSSFCFHRKSTTCSCLRCSANVFTLPQLTQVIQQKVPANLAQKVVVFPISQQNLW